MASGARRACSLARRRDRGCKRRGGFAGNRLQGFRPCDPAGPAQPEAGRKPLRSAPGAEPQATAARRRGSRRKDPMGRGSAPLGRWQSEVAIPPTCWSLPDARPPTARPKRHPHRSRRNLYLTGAQPINLVDHIAVARRGRETVQAFNLCRRRGRPALCHGRYGCFRTHRGPFLPFRGKLFELLLVLRASSVGSRQGQEGSPQYGIVRCPR
jgi:hypothetical protein